MSVCFPLWVCVCMCVRVRVCVCVGVVVCMLSYDMCGCVAWCGACMYMYVVYVWYGMFKCIECMCACVVGVMTVLCVWGCVCSVFCEYVYVFLCVSVCLRVSVWGRAGIFSLL